jgi:putative hydrolase of the HAD superfamily
MQLRAVLFDIGETLWHSRSAPPPHEFRRMAAERAAEILPRLGVADADPAGASRAAWDALEDAIRQARAGNLMEPIYAEVARTALAEHGIQLSREAAGEFLEAIYVSGAEGGKAAFQDAVDVLLELRRRGFLLATVTNRAFGGSRFRADLRAAGLDIGWDAEAVSVEVGYLKPHPAPFKHALERLHVEAGEALMVGDSLAQDIAGAQKIGMLTAWRTSVPDGEGIIPDYTFEELQELLDIPVLAGGLS